MENESEDEERKDGGGVKKADSGEGKRTLCTSLIRHCWDTGFISSLWATLDTMTRRVNKRRVLFSKCAPGNRSSCCSCVGLLSFVCHFNQEPTQEGSFVFGTVGEETCAQSQLYYASFSALFTQPSTFSFSLQRLTFLHSYNFHPKA